MAKLLFSRSAREDLYEIAQAYLELAGEASSRRITERILETASRLEDFPMSGHPMMEHELFLAGFRYVVVEKYLCVYQYKDDIVFVDRIINSTTDYVHILRKLIK